MKDGKKAKTVVILNSKGGVGKSTVSMVLSSEIAGREKYRILIIDADAQSSAISWAAAYDRTPFPAAVVNLAAYGGKIHREIEKHLDNYDIIIIDTPPNLDSMAPKSALLVANLAIIPMPQSPTDIWSSRGLLPIIENAQLHNPELMAFILPNRVTRTTLSRAIMRELEDFGIPLMKSRLSNRTAFQEAAIAGVPVSALGRDARPAAAEVRALADEVLALLGILK